MSLESSPLVSILIISYNQQDFIEEALDSALAQDYQNLEIIVADDGSKDNTPAIIKRYAERYPNKVVPIVDVENLGITGNSNRGFALCKGKYIAFQGGDDVLMPGKISAQVAWFEQDDSRALCFHDMDVFLSETNETLYHQSDFYTFHQGGAEKIIRYGTFFGGTTAMIRADLQGNLKFDSRIPIASDWLFWFEAVETHNGLIGYVDGVYARYRRHNHNITSQSDHEFKEAMLTLDIIVDKYPHYKKMVKQKRSEMHLIDAYQGLKSKAFGRLLSSTKNSIVASGGLWLAPFRLISNKAQGNNGWASKIKRLYRTVRYRQFELQRAVKDGMKHGPNTLFVGKQKFGSEPYLINIGDNCLITDGVRFITHDGSIQVPLIAQGQDINAIYAKYSTFAPIEIGSNVFIGVGSIILPGTKIASDCIVAAGSVVSGEFEQGTVIGGSPAKQISTIEKYWQKNQPRVLDLSNVPSLQQRKSEIIAHVEGNKLRND